MSRISAVMITFNEEQKVGRALSSLEAIADEIVVVDSHSTDATEKICRRFTDRFYSRSWPGYCQQKQFGTDQARFDWVLSLDADEVLSDELRNELLGWKEQQPACDGYYLSRKTFFMGRWIEHTGWFPDWQLRLFRKSAGSWQGGRVHESFRLQGPAGRLHGHLEHYTYASISEYLRQLETFSTLAAADLFERGQRAGLAHLTVHPLSTFVNNYLLRRGFLDGVPGLGVSVLSAVSVFFKYLKLWEKQHGLRTDEPSA